MWDRPHPVVRFQRRLGRWPPIAIGYWEVGCFGTILSPPIAGRGRLEGSAGTEDLVTPTGAKTQKEGSLSWGEVKAGCFLAG
jgi:hypothetical protein